MLALPSTRNYPAPKLSKLTTLAAAYNNTPLSFLANNILLLSLILPLLALSSIKNYSTPKPSKLITLVTIYSDTPLPLLANNISLLSLLPSLALIGNALAYTSRLFLLYSPLNNSNNVLNTNANAI